METTSITLAMFIGMESRVLHEFILLIISTYLCHQPPHMAANSPGRSIWYQILEVTKAPNPQSRDGICLLPQMWSSVCSSSFSQGRCHILADLPWYYPLLPVSPIRISEGEKEAKAHLCPAWIALSPCTHTSPSLFHSFFFITHLHHFYLFITTLNIYTSFEEKRNHAKEVVRS